MQDLLHKAYTLLSKKFMGWFETFVQILPNFVLAIIVLAIFFYFARLVDKLSKRYFHQFFDNKAIIGITDMILYYIIILCGFFVSLNILSLDKTVTSLLAGAGVIGLALSFAFQDLATNFISGIFIAVQKPFSVGDYIHTNNVEGNVLEIGLRHMAIQTLEGQHVVIPSKDVLQASLTNYSKSNERRVQLDIGVSYAEDLRRVESITKEAIKTMDRIILEKGIDVHYHTFGDSSINFTLKFWINKNEAPFYHRAKADAVILIKEAYDREGITIPFPIRTLDFGIKGGEKLQDVWGHTQNKA